MSLLAETKRCVIPATKCSQVFDNFFIVYLVTVIGNPSAREGQTANILTSQTGLCARCSASSISIYERYLMSLLAETKRRAISTTNFPQV